MFIYSDFVFALKRVERGCSLLICAIIRGPMRGKKVEEILLIYNLQITFLPFSDKLTIIHTRLNNTHKYIVILERCWLAFLLSSGYSSLNLKNATVKLVFCFYTAMNIYHYSELVLYSIDFPIIGTGHAVNIRATTIDFLFERVQLSKTVDKCNHFASELWIIGVI